MPRYACASGSSACPSASSSRIACLRQVGADEPADAIGRSLDELRARRRGGDDRHATMRSLVEWSFELLADDERTLLLSLSQFPSPWHRSAAAVLGGSRGDEVLDALVAKSMVMPGSAGHLRILEPVRQYCADVLAAEPVRAGAARHSLVEWGLHVALAYPGDHDPVLDPQAMRALVEQLPNLRAALAAAATAGRGADEAAIMTGLWPLVGSGQARGWFGAQVEDTLSRTTDPDQRRVLIRLALQDTGEHHVDVAREERLITLLRAVDPGEEPAHSTPNNLNRAVRQLVVDRVLGLDPEPTRRDSHVVCRHRA